MNKKFIISSKGQWKYPGKNTLIPNANGKITMKGVSYPVLGIDDQGNRQLMMPGADYQFPGNSVYEIPLAQDGMTGMMKARMAYADAFGNPAGKRMVSPNPPTYIFNGTESDVPAGEEGTHYMASMDNYAVPQLQEQNGRLVFEDFGPESNEAMRFDRPEDAEYFAKHYKNIAPMSRKLKQYQGGGKWLDNLDKYQKGKQFEPITVTNPNDPRLRAYNDSLTLYNDSEKLNAKFRNFVKKNDLLIDEFLPYLPNEKIKPIKGTNLTFQGTGKGNNIKTTGVLKKDRTTIPYDEQLVNSIRNPKSRAMATMLEYKKPVQPVVYQKPVVREPYAPIETNKLELAKIPDTQPVRTSESIAYQIPFPSPGNPYWKRKGNKLIRQNNEYAYNQDLNIADEVGERFHPESSFAVGKDRYYERDGKAYLVPAPKEGWKKTQKMYLDKKGNWKSSTYQKGGWLDNLK